MSSIACGRTGCLFPIEAEKITCSVCSVNFHPNCSNLAPEEYFKMSESNDWKCLNCSASEGAISKNNVLVVKGTRMESPFAISYITSNPNKLRETVQILGDKYASLIRQIDIDLPEYQGSSPEEIARLKCRHAAELVEGPILVEDTCLAFDVLNGLPGPYIKWFLKAVGPEGLNKMLDGFRTPTSGGVEGDSASAICTFAYMSGRGLDTEVVILQGITRGRIVKPRGKSGFGWDPCFAPTEGAGQTYAEMSAETKNSISHRSKAVAKLRQFLDGLPT